MLIEIISTSPVQEICHLSFPSCFPPGLYCLLKCRQTSRHQWISTFASQTDKRPNSLCSQEEPHVEMCSSSANLSWQCPVFSYLSALSPENIVDVPTFLECLSHRSALFQGALLQTQWKCHIHWARLQVPGRTVNVSQPTHTKTTTLFHLRAKNVTVFVLSCNWQKWIKCV